MTQLQAAQVETRPAAIERSFEEGDQVMARDYRLAKERWQHASMMSKVGIKSYLLKLPDGLIWK